MSLILPAAALCGFVLREAQSILPAIREDENTPDKFSFGYYFRRPRNIVLLVMNITSTVALMLAHKEVMAIAGKIPGVGPYVDGSAAPILTGVAIGYLGAWAFRWVSSKLMKVAPEV